MPEISPHQPPESIRGTRASHRYEARLCGADMSRPDVHAVIMVCLEGREHLVDAGYGAPFFSPLPLDLGRDQVVAWGHESYVLKPREAPAARAWSSTGLDR